MFNQLTTYLPSIILGIMLFFSFVVAPVVFTTLDEKNARKIIRRLFPYYYNVNLGISLILLLILIFTDSFEIKFYLVLVVAILFAISNYLLMPIINKFRDENQDKKFKYSHSISVIFNFIQIFILVIILFRYN